MLTAPAPSRSRSPAPARSRCGQPAAASAASFAAAVSRSPPTSAPAWPMRFPAGACRPTSMATTGFGSRARLARAHIPCRRRSRRNRAPRGAVGICASAPAIRAGCGRRRCRRRYARRRAGRCRPRSAAAPWSGSACRCGRAPRAARACRRTARSSPAARRPGTYRPSVFGPTSQDPAARAACAARNPSCTGTYSARDHDGRDARRGAAPHPARPPAGCRSPRHSPARAVAARRRTAAAPSTLLAAAAERDAGDQVGPGLPHGSDLGGRSGRSG